MSEIGKKIKRIMEQRHMSQYRLSKLSGIAQSTISAIISEGQTRSPSVDTVEKLAKALQCSVNDIMQNERPIVIDDGPRAKVLMELDDLSPEEWQRVSDFVSGLKSSRKE